METKEPKSQPDAAEEAVSKESEKPNLKNQTGYSNKDNSSTRTNTDRAQITKTK